MNILFVSNYFKLFDDLDSGASNRSTMFIVALAKLGYVDVVSFRGDDKSNISNCSVIFNDSLSNKAKGNRFEKTLQLFAFHSPNRIYSPNVEKIKIIQSIIEDKHYDYIACRYMREAVECGLLKYSNRLILDVDDNPKDVVLMAAHNAKTLRNKIYNEWFAFTLDVMVKYVLKDVSCCFHSNPNQAPVEKSVYLHNVSISSAIIEDVKESTPRRILMVGSFDYGPNKDGMEYFLKNVWPRVVTVTPDVFLHIVGKVSESNIKEKWEACPNVHVMGFVKDLETEYRDARMVIVPIYSGSGTSVKVVEAMSLNRLCIATPQGVRGYERYMQAGTDYLLADSDESFVDCITQNVGNVEKCNRVAHSAKTKIDKFFSKERFCEIVCAAIINLSHE